ncbi:MAG TPA: hypothetical protein PLN58_06495 [Bacilli bacterium]|nr:hypothetical protein [Bacteroidales bacterium]HQP14318.1 hypothetical protein [Bacilli bacterium]
MGVIEIQVAGLGWIGWIIVFAAIFFLKDIIFKKDKDEQESGKK